MADPTDPTDLSTTSARSLTLPPLELLAGVGDCVSSGEAFTLTAPAGCDLIADPVSGRLTQGAPLFGFDAPAGDFQFSARVSVPGQRSDFDAGVLAVYADERTWAKLCFEFSPDGEPMAVGVVTHRHSDDANGDVIPAERVHLRVSRIGDAIAFHHSPDGITWRFLRVFRWRPERAFSLGFMAQSPLGPQLTVRFDRVALTATTLAHLRNGS